MVNFILRQTLKGTGKLSECGTPTLASPLYDPTTWIRRKSRDGSYEAARAIRSNAREQDAWRSVVPLD